MQPWFFCTWTLWFPLWPNAWFQTSHVPQCNSYTHRLSYEGSKQPNWAAIYTISCLFVSIQDSLTDSTLLLVGMWHFLGVGVILLQCGVGHRALPSFMSSHNWYVFWTLSVRHTNTYMDRHTQAQICREKHTHACRCACTHTLTQTIICTYTHIQYDGHKHKSASWNENGSLL